MKRRRKIKFKIGTVNAITDKISFPYTKCHLCGKRIYFVKAIGMKKIMATLLPDDTYVIHGMVFEEMQRRERSKELKKMSYAKKDNQTNKEMD
jgi:hypothetical protein